MKPFDGETASTGNGVHAAFVVIRQADVDAFHAAALAAGGTDEGVRRLRPHYHADYYAAYARDPDGNKIQSVCRNPE